MNSPGWMLHQNVALLARNTLALPAQARWLVEIHTPDAVPALLALPQLRGLPRRVLGGGSNLLLPDTLEAVVLHPRFVHLASRELDQQTLEVVADAGLNWHALVQWSVSQGWRGIENLALIPGQTGAAPIQNIGAYGVELADTLQWVEWLELDTGKLFRRSRAQLQLGYRDSCFKQMATGSFLILRVCLQLQRHAPLRLNYAGIAEELERSKIAEPQLVDVFEAICALRRRKLPNPTIEPNVGSFFKNPRVPSLQAEALQQQYPELPAWPQGDGFVKLSAAWLIERTGGKGRRLGTAAVAARHALVLVNAGGAHLADILALARSIQSDVIQQFGVELEIEPQQW